MARRVEVTGNSERVASPETERQFNRIFILNRGEIALRILRTCQKMGIGAVVGFSDADANSLAVREALRLQKEDDRFAVAYLGASNQDESYMNYSKAADQAQAYGCQAVHPGYGFGAEKPEAAQEFLDRGIKFIGPSPEVLAKVGDKARAIEIAKQLNIPTIPGSGLLRNYRQARRAARKLGYPVMAKPTDAGGGEGIGEIENQNQLDSTFPALLEKYGKVYFERRLTEVKHVEFQIAADQHGNVICLGDRDCSSQREHQKVLEESPASAIPEDARKRMTEYATKIAKIIGYENLCTVEFLYDPKTDQGYFMEINPRLQVEHPVTEMRTGQDLVEMQIRIAQREKLPEFQLQTNHVMEARIYAEGRDFKKDSGKIYHLQIPEGEGIRTDAGYEENDTVPSEYDKTILKIIVEAPTRQEAITKMAMALRDFEATGMATNKEFLLWLISQPDFVSNAVTTTFIENAWRQYWQKGFRDLGSYLNGHFEEEPIRRRLVPEALPQNFVYVRRGVERNYIEEILAFQRAHPDSCAYRPGWWDKDGIKFALGIWDPSAFGGTLGVEEGNAVMAHFEKAARLSLPLLMVINSGGARQQENSLALQQMDAMVAVARRYRVPYFGILYINSFGGINASIAGQADIKMITKDGEAGLTGPDIIQDTKGEQQERSHYAAHSSGSHAWYRTTDLVVPDPGEALQRFMHQLSVLKLGKSITKEGTFIYPKQLGTIDSIAPLYRAPQHFRFKALIKDISHFVEPLLRRLKDRREVITRQKEPSNEEVQELLDNAYRPTSAEYMSEELGVFNHVAPLSNMVLVEEALQYPPIIGAFVNLNEKPMLVLGQQAQRRQVGGHYVKEYVGIRPEDFRWARQKVELADRLGIDILLLADTSGAAADEKAEQGGIEDEISSFLSVTHNIGVNVSSVLHGRNGSGGGLTFARPVNWAAEFSYAQSHVADPRVMARILNGHQPTVQELSSIIRQSRDSRAEVRFTMGLIDRIIYEPPGGTQTDPFMVTRQVRDFLIEGNKIHENYTRAQTQEEKLKRSINAAQFATRPL